MTDYGWCLDSTGSRCSGKCQPGTLALRSAIRDLFPGIGDLGCYNCRPSSGGGGLSTHGEGRGWDAACNANTQKALGDRLATWLILHARELGVQRIIWNHRQWDSKTRKWRAYNGQSPHTDHLHIELCWSSARDNPLTVGYIKSVYEEDDMPSLDEVRKVIAEELDKRVGKPDEFGAGATTNKALYESVGGTFVDGIKYIRGLVEAIKTKVGA